METFKFEIQINNSLICGTVDYQPQNMTAPINRAPWLSPDPELNVKWKTIEFISVMTHEVEIKEPQFATAFAHGFIEGYGVEKFKWKVEQELWKKYL
jgi:hypothetical protein